jgi:hypothetical protein
MYCWNFAAHAAISRLISAGKKMAICLLIFGSTLETGWRGQSKEEKKNKFLWRACPSFRKQEQRHVEIKAARWYMYFCTKNVNFGIVWKALNAKFCFISRPFGMLIAILVNFYEHLVFLWQIWFHFSRFGFCANKNLASAIEMRQKKNARTVGNRRESKRKRWLCDWADIVNCETGNCQRTSTEHKLSIPRLWWNVSLHIVPAYILGIHMYVHEHRSTRRTWFCLL